MFIAALIIVAKTWKQPRCPSVSGMNNYTVASPKEYYSVLTWLDQSSHEKSWRNLKCLSLSERRQSGKVT